MVVVFVYMRTIGQKKISIYMTKREICMNAAVMMTFASDIRVWFSLLLQM